jgi:hypothetical protein
MFLQKCKELFTFQSLDGVPLNSIMPSKSATRHFPTMIVIISFLLTLIALAEPVVSFGQYQDIRTAPSSTRPAQPFDVLRKPWACQKGNGDNRRGANCRRLAAVVPSRDQDLQDKENESAVMPDRKSFIGVSLSLAAAVLLSGAPPARAAYKGAPKSEGFNYIDFLIEKNQQVDTNDSLYKGFDNEVQLRRILEASKRLAEIPDIARAKKWSQVQGLLTGPLGTLLQTMQQLVGTSADAKKAAALVKSDIIAIGQQAAKKNDEGCVQATEAALNDLGAFLKVVFPS